MKKAFFTGMFALGSILSHAQSEQLSKWFIPPMEIDFRTASPAAVNTGGPGIGSFENYNCWYEDGQLLFYVLADGNVYDHNHQVVANLLPNLNYGEKLRGEIAIFPHSDNFTDLCTRKFCIIANIRGSYPLAVGNLCLGIVDFSPGNTPSLTHLNNIPDNNTSSGIYETYQSRNPIAVSPMNAAGQRFVYVGDDVYGLRAYKFSPPNTMSQIYSDYTNHVLGNEMELSNNGNKLAFISGNNDLEVWDVSTNIPTYAVANLGNTAGGFEFDATGDKIFFNGSGSINVYDFTTGITSPVANTNYAESMEKSFKDGSTAQYIICSNFGNLTRINAATNTVDPGWSLTVQNAHYFPDQIDGEDVNDPMFKVITPNPFRARCSPTTFNVAFRVHPYILNYYSSLYTLNVLNIGNISGVYPQSQWTVHSNPSLSSGNVPIYINATASFMFRFYKIGDPTCLKEKSFTLYMLSCPNTGTFTPFPFNPSQYTTGVYAQPDYAAEEQLLTGFGNSWMLQELDDETHMPLYSIDKPACWETAAGQENPFRGFDPVNHDYTQDGFTCNSETGIFKVGHTYRILREVWADNLSRQLYEEVFTVADRVTLKSVAQENAQAAAEGIADETQVYPNPSTGKLHVKTSLEMAGSIEVYDMLGNRILTTPVNDGAQETSLDLSSLAKGIYNLRISSGSNVLTRKIVIE